MKRKEEIEKRKARMNKLRQVIRTEKVGQAVQSGEEKPGEKPEEGKKDIPEEHEKHHKEYS